MFKHLFNRSAREALRKSREMEEALVESIAHLDPVEARSVRAAVEQFKNSDRRSIGKDTNLYQERLNSIWHPEPFVSEPGVLYMLRFPDPEKEDVEKNLPWSLSLSDEFVKETTSIDRKLQGRILESLIQIASRPLELRGDTQKPLTGNLAGLWRVRLGDYRLIYRPDKKEKRVYCMAFSSRGGAYA